jgi:hypothetical protein
MADQQLGEWMGTCPRTGKRYSTGMRSDAGSAVVMIGQKTPCPHCGEVHVASTVTGEIIWVPDEAGESSAT